MFRKIPPCPGNPEHYVLVKTKEGYYWRKKRGTVKAAPLNAVLQANADATKIVSPAAKRIMDSLQAYLNGINTGRLNVRIGRALRRSLKERSDYKMHTDAERIFIDIPISQSIIKPLNRLVSHYYFEAVLLYGDASMEEGLRAESVQSALYDISGKEKAVCVLEFPLPPEDWCVLLKLSSLEENELAAHTKHYRMKVIGARRA